MSANDAGVPRRADRPRRGDHLFLAPNINSYKRFVAGTFAPTQDGLVDRQPHRRLPAVSARNAVGAHRVPHRRRRPQPLPGLRRPDRRRNRRHRAGPRARAGVPRRRLPRGAACRRSRRRCATRPRRCAARRCCAPPSATRSSTTTSMPPAGSRPSPTAASPTGRWRAASSAREASRTSFRRCSPTGWHATPGATRGRRRLLRRGRRHLFALRAAGGRARGADAAACELAGRRRVRQAHRGAGGPRLRRRRLLRGRLLHRGRTPYGQRVREAGTVLNVAVRGGPGDWLLQISHQLGPVRRSATRTSRKRDPNDRAERLHPTDSDAAR